MKLTHVISMGAASATAAIGWLFMSPSPAKSAQVASAEIKPAFISSDRNSESAKPLIPMPARASNLDTAKPAAPSSEPVKAENAGLLMLQPDVPTHSNETAHITEVVKTPSMPGEATKKADDGNKKKDDKKNAAKPVAKKLPPAPPKPRDAKKKAPPAPPKPPHGKKKAPAPPAPPVTPPGNPNGN